MTVPHFILSLLAVISGVAAERSQEPDDLSLFTKGAAIGDS